MFTDNDVRRIARGKVDENNMRSAMTSLRLYGPRIGLDKPWRAPQYLAQIMHESGEFRYDREVWGPTPAQQRYDTRTDLGNTAARDGDGFLFRGRSGIQITGKANYAQFREWCRKTFDDLAVPDFVAKPDLVCTDPWEGLGPIWYWTTRDLNRFADDGNIEMITRRINGGLNGYDDRIALYARASLVLLGYGASNLLTFQRSMKLVADDIAGPKTRAALHRELKAMPEWPKPSV